MNKENIVFLIAAAAVVFWLASRKAQAAQTTDQLSRKEELEASLDRTYAELLFLDKESL